MKETEGDNAPPVKDGQPNRKTILPTSINLTRLPTCPILLSDCRYLIRVGIVASIVLGSAIIRHCPRLVALVNRFRRTRRSGGAKQTNVGVAQRCLPIYLAITDALRLI